MRFTRLASLLTVLIVCVVDADPLGPPPAQTSGSSNASPRTGTGAISGVVIDGSTKTPLPGVVVFLGPERAPEQPGPPQRQVTDAKGRFIFRDLPAFAGYFIDTSRFGYLDSSYGRRRSGPRRISITLTEGQWFNEANVTMWRPAAISGRVVDHLNEPVVGVYVRVLAKVLIAGRSHLAAGPVTTTDDRGVYRIANLLPGTYFVQIPSVQASLPPPPAGSRDGSAPADPAASFSTMQMEGGNRLLLGRYVTPLSPEDGRARAYPPTFYPGTTALVSAAEIDVQYGDERDGVDIRLEPVQTFVVSGRLEGPLDGVGSLPLRLIPAGLEELGDGSEVATSFAAADGMFTFLNVPAGSYTLDVRRTVAQFELRPVLDLTVSLPRPIALQGGGGGGSGIGIASGPPGTTISTRTIFGGEAYWSRTAVAVDRRDVRDLVVVLRRAVTMRGRFEWEDGSGRGGVSFRLEPASGAVSLGMPRPNLVEPPFKTFVVEGLLPGEYIITGTGPRLKSIAWNGRDYTNRPFDASSGQDIDDVVITLTDQSIRLSGAVRSDRGATIDDAAVIVFPVEPEQWTNFGFTPPRLKAVPTTIGGRYVFEGLRAGDYYVIAVNVEDIDGWKDPAFLIRAATIATRISLAWGDKIEQPLRIVPIK